MISPNKADILRYYGAQVGSAAIAYTVQPRPAGLCDALFRASPLIDPAESVLIGLPDTIWYPENGFTTLAHDGLCFLLFPVERPELFDAVATRTPRAGRTDLGEIRDAGSRWIWGAMRMPGSVLHDLHRLWCSRDRRDEYLGTLVNAWLASGGTASGVRAGAAYVDVGTLNGYRAALELLQARGESDPPAFAGPSCWRRINGACRGSRVMTDEELTRQRIDELGPWFHNMRLGGVWTAPEHFLGDYPNVKWQRFAHAIPPISPAGPCSTSAATAASTPSR